MRRHLVVLAGCLLCALSVRALALDMPARKAGQWELKMSFDNGAIPVQTLRQCIDAVTDKLMKSDFGGSPQQTCEKQDISRSGATLVVDSVCSFHGVTSTTHAVVTGSFDSAYTMEITSKRQGGPAVPGMASGSESHMTIAAKWLGPCADGQRPGDIIMSNGMKMNVLDMKKAVPHRPQLPQR
jgi:Protein of unknown function (DUF3617)